MRGGGGIGFNKEKGISALAWISYILAIAGGAALAGTFVGDVLVSIIGVFPGWVATVLFTAAFVVMAIDLFVDGIPNQLALYIGILLPSIARSVPGKLSDTVTRLSHELLGRMNDSMGAWLGTSSALALGAAAVVAALLTARRVIAKGGR